MDVTGIRVSVDASEAKRGEQQFNASLDSMAQRARTISQQLGDAMKPGEKSFSSLGNTARTVSTQMAEAFGTIRFGFRGLLDSIVNFRTLFDVAIAGISFKEVIDQIAKFQDIKFALQAVVGSAAEASGAWKMLEHDAERFGFQAEDLGGKFARLQMSTRGTALEGERTVQVFRAAEVAARALGGGSEAAERALQSFTNILSSATMQGDMIVRQLARFGGIPDAMGIAARAFGMNVNQMIATLRSGMLSSEEFVDKFTKQMLKELTPAAEAAANSISAWKERVAGAFASLMGQMGEGGLGSTIIKFLKDLDEQLMSPAFREAAQQIGGLLANALRTLGGVIQFAGQHIGLLKAAIGGLVAFEVIDFIANFAKNLLILERAAIAAATAIRGLSAAKSLEVAGSVAAGVASAIPFALAQGGVMTSQGPMPLHAGGGETAHGRITRIRRSQLSTGVIGHPDAPVSAFAHGGVMTSHGSLPLHKYADGGVATRPQMAMFGEGSKPEAFVPLQDGTNVPVVMQMSMSSGTPSPSGAYVPLAGGRRIPVAITIERAVSQQTQPEANVPLINGNSIPVSLRMPEATDSEAKQTSPFTGATLRLTQRMQMIEEAVYALERNTGIIPASHGVPPYVPARLSYVPTSIMASPYPTNLDADVALGPLITLLEPLKKLTGAHTYAKGGVAEGPQVGVLGDAGRPEAVIPLDASRKVPVSISVQSPMIAEKSSTLSEKITEGLAEAGKRAADAVVRKLPDRITIQPKMQEPMRYNIGGKASYYADGGLMAQAQYMSDRDVAHGGVTARPRLAIFGEGSGPEAFVPMTKDMRVPLRISDGRIEIALPNGRSLPTSIDGQTNKKCFGDGGVTAYNIGGKASYYNMGGLCYSDGGAAGAYNMGGLCYNMGGLCYSDGGAYNMGGLCYNMGGLCYADGGTTSDPDKKDDTTSSILKSIPSALIGILGSVALAEGVSLLRKPKAAPEAAPEAAHAMVSSGQRGEHWGPVWNPFIEMPTVYHNVPAKDRIRADVEQEIATARELRPQVEEFRRPAYGQASLAEALQRQQSMLDMQEQGVKYWPGEGLRQRGFGARGARDESIYKVHPEQGEKISEFDYALPFFKPLVAAAVERERKMAGVESLLGEKVAEAAREGGMIARRQGVQQLPTSVQTGIKALASAGMTEDAIRKLRLKAVRTADTPLGVLGKYRPDYIGGKPSIDMDEGWLNIAKFTEQYPEDKVARNAERTMAETFVHEIGHALDKPFAKGAGKTYREQVEARKKAAEAFGVSGVGTTGSLLAGLVGRGPEARLNKALERSDSVSQFGAPSEYALRGHSGEWVAEAFRSLVMGSPEEKAAVEKNPETLGYVKRMLGLHGMGARSWQAKDIVGASRSISDLMMPSESQATRLGLRPQGIATEEVLRDVIAQSGGLKQFATPTYANQDVTFGRGPERKQLMYGGLGQIRSETQLEPGIYESAGNEIKMGQWHPTGVETVGYSALHPALRDRGLGKLMYLQAAADAQKRGVAAFGSDTAVSDEASHVWESMMKMGLPIQRKGPQLNEAELKYFEKKNRDRYVMDLSKAGDLQKLADQQRAKSFAFAEGGAMTERGPMQLPTRPQGVQIQPYANSQEMMEDVRRNRHLSFFRGGNLPADHPLAATEPRTGYTYNDMFRAVHDLYGHAAGGFQFGPKGEDAAYRTHARMFSPEAIPALTSETRGQNNWVNFGPHMRGANGELLKPGDAGYLPPLVRPYAEQKAGILPSEFHEKQNAEAITPALAPRPMAIADAYGSMRHSPENPAVKRSYDAMKRDLYEQWTRAAREGIKFEPWDTNDNLTHGMGARGLGRQRGTPPEQMALFAAVEEHKTKQAAAQDKWAKAYQEMAAANDAAAREAEPVRAQAKRRPQWIEDMLAQAPVLDRSARGAVGLPARTPVEAVATGVHGATGFPLAQRERSSAERVIAEAGNLLKTTPPAAPRPLIPPELMPKFAEEVAQEAAERVRQLSGTSALNFKSNFIEGKLIAAQGPGQSNALLTENEKFKSAIANRVESILRSRPAVTQTPAVAPRIAPAADITVGYTGAQRKLFELLGKRFAVAEPTLADIVKFASPHLAQPGKGVDPRFIWAGYENAAYDLGDQNVLRTGFAKKENIPQMEEFLQPLAQKVVRAPIIQSERPDAPQPDIDWVGKNMPVRMQIMPKVLTKRDAQAQSYDFQYAAEDMQRRIWNKGKYWSDAHSGNVGMDPRTGQFKVTDLGWLYEIKRNALGELPQLGRASVSERKWKQLAGPRDIDALEEQMSGVDWVPSVYSRGDYGKHYMGARAAIPGQMNLPFGPPLGPQINLPRPGIPTDEQLRKAFELTLRDKSRYKDYIGGNMADANERGIANMWDFVQPHITRPPLYMAAQPSYIGGGGEHETFDIGGGKVFKIGPKENYPDQPAISPLLQAFASERFKESDMHAWILPKALPLSDAGLGKRKINGIIDKLEAEASHYGVSWADRTPGNVGLYPPTSHGKPYIIDPGMMGESRALPEPGSPEYYLRRAQILQQQLGVHGMADRGVRPQGTEKMGLFGPMLRKQTPDKTSDLTEVARRLQDYTRKELQLKPLRPSATEQKLFERAIQLARPEFQKQMQNPQQAGMRFYEEMPMMHAEFSKLHPELTQDPKLAGFVTAITSAASLGRDSATTMKTVDDMYSAFKEAGTGLIPMRQPGGKAWGGYSYSVLENLNEMLKATGSPQATYDFLTTKHRSKEIENIVGKKIKGTEPDDMVYGAFGMSPTVPAHKAGNFFLDMASASDPALAAAMPPTGPNAGGTLDRWMSRQFHRWMGTPLSKAGMVEEQWKPKEDAVMRQVLDKLSSERGISRKQTQAVMWNFEQNLWKAAGADIEPQQSYGREMKRYVANLTSFLPLQEADDATHGMAARGFTPPLFSKAQLGAGFSLPRPQGMQFKPSTEDIIAKINRMTPGAEGYDIEQWARKMATTSDLDIRPEHLKMLMQQGGKLYHGTTEDKLPGILTEGLIPNRNRMWDLSLPGYNYLTPNLDNAKDWGRRGDPAVVEVGLPKQLARQLKYDVNLGGKAARNSPEEMPQAFVLGDRIPPNLIKRVMTWDFNQYKQKEETLEEARRRLNLLDEFKFPPDGIDVSGKHGMAIRPQGVETDIMRALDRTYGGALTDQMRTQMVNFVAPHATQAKYLAGGAESQVFDIAPDKVARFGAGGTPPFPKIPEVLQPLATTLIPGRFSGDMMHGEIMPKVETRTIMPDDLRIMRARMDELGFKWDSKMDNLGKYLGELKIIDTGGMFPKNLGKGKPLPEQEEELKRMQQNPFFAFEGGIHSMAARGTEPSGDQFVYRGQMKGDPVYASAPHSFSATSSLKEANQYKNAWSDISNAGYEVVRINLAKVPEQIYEKVRMSGPERDWVQFKDKVPEAAVSKVLMPGLTSMAQRIVPNLKPLAVERKLSGPQLSTPDTPFQLPPPMTTDEYFVRRQGMQIAPTFGQDMFAAHRATEGATFDPRTGQNLMGSQKWAVAIAPELTQVMTKMPQPQDFSTFADKNRDLFERFSAAQLGSWHDLETGLHHLDVVGLTASRERALKTAFAFGEKGIFNLATKEYLPSGYTKEERPLLRSTVGQRLGELEEEDTTHGMGRRTRTLSREELMPMIDIHDVLKNDARRGLGQAEYTKQTLANDQQRQLQTLLNMMPKGAATDVHGMLVETSRTMRVDVSATLVKQELILQRLHDEIVALGAKRDWSRGLGQEVFQQGYDPAKEASAAMQRAYEWEAKTKYGRGMGRRGVAYSPMEENPAGDILIRRMEEAARATSATVTDSMRVAARSMAQSGLSPMTARTLPLEKIKLTPSLEFGRYAEYDDALKQMSLTTAKSGAKFAFVVAHELGHSLDLAAKETAPELRQVVQQEFADMQQRVRMAVAELFPNKAQLAAMWSGGRMNFLTQTQADLVAAKAGAIGRYPMEGDYHENIAEAVRIKSGFGTKTEQQRLEQLHPGTSLFADVIMGKAAPMPKATDIGPAQMSEIAAMEQFAAATQGGIPRMAILSEHISNLSMAAQMAAFPLMEIAPKTANMIFTLSNIGFMLPMLANLKPMIQDMAHALSGRGATTPMVEDLGLHPMGRRGDNLEAYRQKAREHSIAATQKAESAADVATVGANLEPYRQMARTHSLDTERRRVMDTANAERRVFGQVFEYTPIPTVPRSPVTGPGFMARGEQLLLPSASNLITNPARMLSAWRPPEATPQTEQKLVGITEAMAAAISGRIATIKTNWHSMWQSVGEFAKDSSASILGTLDNLGQRGRGLLMRMMGGLKFGFEDFVNYMASGNKLGKLNTGIASLLSFNKPAAVSVAVEGEKTLASAAGAGGAGALAGELESATGAAGGLMGSLSGLLPILGLIGAGIAAIAAALYLTRNRQIEINGEAFKMSDVYSGIWMKIKEATAAYWNWLKYISAEVFSFIGSTGKGALDGIFGKGTTDKVENYIKTLWEGFKGLFYETTKQAKDAREQLEESAKIAEGIRSKFGGDPYPDFTEKTLKGEGYKQDTIDKIMQLEAQLPKAIQGKKPEQVQQLTLEDFTGVKGLPAGKALVTVTQEDRDKWKKIGEQIMMLYMGATQNDMEFRTPPPQWQQALNELQAKASLAGPTALAGMYGADEVEKLRQAAEAERMIAEYRHSGMGPEVANEIRAYYAIIAEGNDTLKLNSDLLKERSKALSTPTFGHTPTFEFIDSGDKKPELEWQSKIAAANKGLMEPTMNVYEVSTLGLSASLIGHKLSIEQYNKSVTEATVTFRKFMDEHKTAIQLKPLGFEDVVDAINHGVFAYQSYLSLEQQEMSILERFHDRRDLADAMNKEAEANYKRAAALKFYAGVKQETEKLDFEAPRLERMTTARLQGPAAVRQETAQQKIEEQLFQQTGAKNVSEFEKIYRDVVNTPGMIPTLEPFMPGAMPPHVEQKGPLGTEIDPYYVKMAGTNVSEMQMKSEIQRQAEFLGVPPAIALAVAKQESGFKQFDAYGGVVESGKHALGVMQLTKPTADELGVDPTNTMENIHGGLLYLLKLYSKFGDWSTTLMAYNMGPGNVAKGVTPPLETKNYVTNVMADAEKMVISQLPPPLSSPSAVMQEQTAAQTAATPTQMEKAAQFAPEYRVDVTATAPEVPLLQAQEVPNKITERVVNDFFAVMQKAIEQWKSKLAADDKAKAVEAEAGALMTLDPASVLKDYKEKMDNLNLATNKHKELWFAAKLAAIEYTDAVGQQLDDLAMRTKTFMGGLQAGFNEFARASKDMAQLGKKIADDFTGGLTKTLTEIATGNISKQGIGQMFKDTFKPMMADMAEGQIKRYITGPISGALGQVFGVKMDGGSVNEKPKVSDGAMHVKVMNLPGSAEQAATNPAAAALGAFGLASGITGGDAASGNARTTNPILAALGAARGTTTFGTMQAGHSSGGNAGWAQFLVNPLSKARDWLGGQVGNLLNPAKSFVGDFFSPTRLSQIAGGPSLAQTFTSGMAGGGIPAVADTLPLPGLASGGPVTGGRTYMVGERGPELFTASSGGYVRAFATGGTMSRTGSTGGSGLPMSAIPSASGAGEPIGIINDPITKQPRWTTFSHLVQATPGGGFGPPAGAILPRHGDQPSFWDSFLPVMLMFLSNLQMVHGMMGGGGSFANAGDSIKTPSYMPGGGDITAPSMSSIFGGGNVSMAGLPGFEHGGVMTPFGAVRLNNYDSGGIATSPQMAIFGEGRMPEAYVPLPDGRTIPVNMRGNGGQSTPRANTTYRTEVHIHGVENVDAFRRSRSQIISSVSEAQSTQTRRRKN